VTVAAIVVRWRGGDEVDRCLRSLVDHGGSALRSIVLVDSGSADGGAAALASGFPHVDVLALDENRSFAWAADRGAERCTEPLLLLRNPDAELTPGSLDALVEFTRHHPEAAGAAPLLYGDDGHSQCRWQLRRLPGWTRLAVGLGGARAFAAGPHRRGGRTWTSARDSRHGSTKPGSRPARASGSYRRAASGTPDARASNSSARPNS